MMSSWCPDPGLNGWMLQFSSESLTSGIFCWKIPDINQESFKYPSDMALGSTVGTTFCSSQNFRIIQDECCSNGWAWRFPPKVFEPLNFLAAFEWVHGSSTFTRSQLKLSWIETKGFGKGWWYIPSDGGTFRCRFFPVPVDLLAW